MPDLEQLGARAEQLRQEVVGLREDVQSLSERTQRAEGRLVWVAVAAAIALLLAVAIGVTAWRVTTTDRRVDALCPLLSLSVGSYNPNSRPAGPGRDQYVAAFGVLRQAYSDLGCTQPPVPPRTAAQ